MVQRISSRIDPDSGDPDLGPHMSIPEYRYPHSKPDDYISIRDPDALEALLRRDASAGKATFETSAFKRTDPEKQVKWMLVEHQSAFGETNRAFEHLKEAKKSLGDRKGWRKKFKLQSAYEHSVGVGMLAYNIQMSSLDAAKDVLRQRCDEMTAIIPHFSHQDVLALCKHNVMCAENLLAQIKTYIATLNEAMDPEQYTGFIGWISLQWERFTLAKKRRKGQ